MIEAILFDMDGLLIDSEPAWRQAEIEVFARVGVPLTPELCEKTTGLRLDAVVQHWYERFAWTNISCAQVVSDITERVVELIEDVEPLPGVHEIIAEAAARNLRLGLCSSSPYVLIHRVVAKLGLPETFILHSAQDEVYGKPHPAAYMTTADKCQVAYSRCIVFEDSLHGAIAAKAAGMHVVAIPQGDAYASSRFDFCDAKIQSLREFDRSYFDRFSMRRVASNENVLTDDLSGLSRV